MSKRTDIQNGFGSKKKPGRPTVLERKKDPYLALRAVEMRSLGFSWSQIASRLGIGRTTARRLVLMYQKRNENQTAKNLGFSVPKQNVVVKEKNGSQRVSDSKDDDMLVKLPKTFQIFSNLLERVRRMQSDRRV